MDDATIAPRPPHASRRARRPSRSTRPGSGASAYREAWDLQKALAAARADETIGDRLLLLEHAAVLTLGRQADEAHVLASPDELAARGIEVIRVERGGEVTYHGPGQLVAYPIIAPVAARPPRPAARPRPRGRDDRDLRARSASRPTGATATPAAGATRMGPRRARSARSGIRVERGVSYHGIALNIDPDLADFDLIDPCGMPGVVSTSIAARLAGRTSAPSTAPSSAPAAVFADASLAARRSGARRVDRTMPGPTRSRGR